MQNKLKLLLVVGLLVLMMPLLFGYLLGPVSADHNDTVVKQHQDSKDVKIETCVGVGLCHDPNELEPNDAIDSGVHRRHFVSTLNFYGDDPSVSEGCGDCHYETVYTGGVDAGLGSGYEGDLSYTDSPSSGETSTTSGTTLWTRAANKQVKPDVCENCHGQFLDGDILTSGHAGTSGTVTMASTCVEAGTCHIDPGSGGAPTSVHATSGYISQDYSDSPTFCVRCHGELAWYQTHDTTVTLQ